MEQTQRKTQSEDASLSGRKVREKENILHL